MMGKRGLEQFLRRPAEELYDLEKDPAEVRNLVGDPEQAKTLEHFRRKLRACQEKTGDPWVIKYTHE